MRKLDVEDMYLLSEIADKMEFTMPKYPEIPDKMSKAEKEAVVKTYGAEIITFIIRKIHKAKIEVNQLIANATEKSIDEVKKMSPGEMIAIIKEILKQDGVLDFFK